MFIDAHNHYINKTVNDIFHEGFSNMAKDTKEVPYTYPDKIGFSMEDLLNNMKEAGVTTTFLVAIDDLEIINRFNLTNPKSFYILYMYLKRNAEENLKDLIKKKTKYPELVIGTKTILPYFFEEVMSKELFPFYDYCSEEELPIQFHIGGSPTMNKVSEKENFVALTKKFKKLKIVLLHAGSYWWKDVPEVIKSYENIYIECEALQIPELSDEDPKVLNYLINSGIEKKIIFGSDVTGHDINYFKRVNAIKKLNKDLQNLIAFENVINLYKIKT